MFTITHHAQMIRAQPLIMSAAVEEKTTSAKWKTGDPEPMMIGIAADSGCGKSTFMKRIVQTLGAEVTDAHTPQGDLMTVICLDDYHLNDRAGRKVSGKTALHPEEQLFDLMAEQTEALKAGKQIMKPIYNHDTGMKDPEEPVDPNHIIVLEGLHPMVDERVRNMLNFGIYVDVADDVKYAWKISRDMKERGWTEDEVKASIEGRKPDFAAYVEPQKMDADVVIQILPSEMKDAAEGGYRVRLIQMSSNDKYKNAGLLASSANAMWQPEGHNFIIKQYPEKMGDKEATVLEFDGVLQSKDDMKIIEPYLFNTGTKNEGELTTQHNSVTGLGSLNGTGLMQSIVALKIRELYEATSKKE